MFNQARAQLFADDVADGLSRLDRAVCLQQWSQAIAITSELITSSNVSSEYRQELLNFRRQLQVWQVSPLPPTSRSSCDRTLPLVLTVPEESVASAPQPLNWNRALFSLGSTRPIVELDEDFDPMDHLIPAALIASSPEVLAAGAIPIDTADGFNVVGGRISGQHQVYSFLARLGDPVSLEVNVTRTYTQGEMQLYVFDQTGRLIAQSESPTFPDGATQDFIAPKTDVYFAVVSPQGTVPILNAQGGVLDWQTNANTSFDYTLTLMGVTPYTALVP
ncbi:MAG: hypothetical protein AAF579_03905 [Cyanobacteria bacterium P01_C01_bin.118]